MVTVGILDWLKRMVSPPPKRSVARLQAVPESDVDLVFETVDVSGGPLREHHRRQAFRDGRLLPKKKQIFGGGKHPSYMPAREARRFFSSTMRTHDRSIRDLLADEEQLKRYGLPLWKTEKDLAGALGISPGELAFFSIHREMERSPHYVTFSIPKSSGGARVIMAPKKRLKELQRRLLQALVEKLPVSPCAHGFIRLRSTVTGARPHAGRQVVVNMDLKDFFPSVHFGRVRGYLVALGYGYVVATVLAVLMTEAERQPVDVEGTIYHVPVTPRYCVQGAPTSPGICNAIVHKMDRRLSGYGKALGFTYTRYADDLTFSGDDLSQVKALLGGAARIVSEEGFTVHPGKTSVMRKGRRQTVTGIVVNKVPGLSRKERRRIRARIHRFQKSSPAAEELRSLRGKLAYLSMINLEQAEKLKALMNHPG
ncbi:MAG: reverse transcriptase family protein [Candidatus Eremiobacteraeota bacterium]|nr:reverse transcriptase family protein [Candidatus Eremiobacteraeota bacterium]